ncbi:MAG: hypothetical protein Q8L60_10585 [Gammaproteobacteria bacterium]|nr:hypothetical protein [Gammaproteobacteria bacterium]MDP2346794.1 hypothetical protein [Gammaproteobacteria bacterium]
MSKWGLLRGAGQGAAQAGNMLMADTLDRMKEERLQKYQQGMQDKQFEREDTIRAEDQAIRSAERTEDRNERELADVRQITLRANERVQDQANVDRQFEVSTSLVNRQIEQINQEIDLNGMELDRQRDIKSVWDKIQETEDPAQLETLFDRYRRLTGTDKDDKYSLHSIPEYDDMGERIGTDMYTHNSRTNEITPYIGGAAQSRPSLAELLGTAADNAAQPQVDGQPAPTQGLLRPQPEAPRSPEAQSVLARREAEQQGAQQQRQQQESERAIKSADDTLSSIELNVVGNGRATGIPVPSRDQMRRYEDQLLQVIESDTATGEQKTRARTLLRQIEAKL